MRGVASTFRWLDDDVVDFETLLSTVLHPEQLLLGGRETGATERSGPAVRIDGNRDLIMIENNSQGVPSILGKIEILGRETLVGAKQAARLVGGTTWID